MARLRVSKGTDWQLVLAGVTRSARSKVEATLNDNLNAKKKGLLSWAVTADPSIISIKWKKSATYQSVYAWMGRLTPLTQEWSLQPDRPQQAVGTTVAVGAVADVTSVAITSGAKSVAVGGSAEAGSSGDVPFEFAKGIASGKAVAVGGAMVGGASTDTLPCAVGTAVAVEATDQQARASSFLLVKFTILQGMGADLVDRHFKRAYRAEATPVRVTTCASIYHGTRQANHQAVDIKEYQQGLLVGKILTEVTATARVVSQWLLYFVVLWFVHHKCG
jgi:hypothetical protein